MMRSLITLTLTGAALLAGCDNGGDANTTVGYVEAEWRYAAAPSGGWIVDMPVAEGDRVAVGDVLFALDVETEQAARAEADARRRQAEAEAANIDTGARKEEVLALRARLDEAEARLTRAEADFERVMPLVEKALEPASRGDAVTAERDAARAGVQALRRDIRVAELAGRPEARAAATAAAEGARAALDRADYALSLRTTTAQFAGRVEDRILEPGEYATPGAPVLALLPDDGLMVRFFVPQADLPAIALGTDVTITADGLDAPITTAVSHIATEAEFTPPVIYSRDMRDKLVFLVEARLPAGTPLRPGLPVDVAW